MLLEISEAAGYILKKLLLVYLVIFYSLVFNALSLSRLVHSHPFDSLFSIPFPLLNIAVTFVIYGTGRKKVFGILTSNNSLFSANFFIIS